MSDSISNLTQNLLDTGAIPRNTEADATHVAITAVHNIETLQALINSEKFQMDNDLQKKREAIKKQIIEFGHSTKATLIFSLTILICATGALITLFLGDAYDFLNLCFVVPCIWMAALRLFLYRREFPESRFIRWSFRFVLFLSIATSILLITHLVN